MSTKKTRLSRDNVTNLARSISDNARLMTILEWRALYGHVKLHKFIAQYFMGQFFIFLHQSKEYFIGNIMQTKKTRIQ